MKGKPHFDKPETEAVAHKMYELTELQKQEKFSVKRDKDMLSTSIRTKEHGGRIRGMSSKLTFRDGFKEDRSTYKKHDRYKEEMIQAAEKAAESKFKEMFAQLAEQQSWQIWMNPLQVGQQQSGQMVTMPPSSISTNEYGMCSEQCCLNHSTTISGKLHHKYYSMHATLSNRQSWKDGGSCQGARGSCCGFI